MTASGNLAEREEFLGVLGSGFTLHMTTQSHYESGVLTIMVLHPMEARSGPA